MKLGVKTIGIILELLHLGNAIAITTPFLAETKSAGLFSIEPTLSPKDPNFPAWWEQHKSEWEENKKVGQEPADD